MWHSIWQVCVPQANWRPQGLAHENTFALWQGSGLIYKQTFSFCYKLHPHFSLVDLHLTIHTTKQDAVKFITTYDSRYIWGSWKCCNLWAILMEHQIILYYRNVRGGGGRQTPPFLFLYVCHRNSHPPCHKSKLRLRTVRKRKARKHHKSKVALNNSLVTGCIEGAKESESNQRSHSKTEQIVK